MRGLAKAIMSGDRTELDASINFEALRHAVSRKIFCPHTDTAMDVNRAVLVTVTRAGNTVACEVMSGPAWDGIGETLTARVAAIGADLEIIDGRHYTKAGTLRAAYRRQAS